MRVIGDFVFPDPGNTDECNSWECAIRKRALARRVLCVARTRIEGAWCAYCDAVPGCSHEYEYWDVLQRGAKLPEGVARTIFPMFSQLPYAE